jgi:hypothetical protein
MEIILIFIFKTILKSYQNASKALLVFFLLKLKINLCRKSSPSSSHPQIDSLRYWALQSLIDILISPNFASLPSCTSFPLSLMSTFKSQQEMILGIPHFWMKFGYLYAVAVRVLYPDWFEGAFGGLIEEVRNEENMGMLKFLFVVSHL